MAGRYKPTADEVAFWTARAKEYEQKTAAGTMTLPDWVGQTIHALFIAQDDEAALVACERALDLDSNAAVLWDMKGCALGGLGRHKEALAAFDRALQLDPDLAIAQRHKDLVPQ
jgi:tetratricopeptide (TPR) repeat protein